VEELKLSNLQNNIVKDQMHAKQVQQTHYTHT